MSMKTVKIAITDIGGNVAVMDFITIFRGDSLPFGGEWSDKALGWWKREDSDENILHEIKRGESSYLKPTASWRRIEAGEIPPDRTFREAWKDTGSKLDVHMPKAREIHLQRVRVARAAKLEELDREWMRATGQGKKADAEAAEAKRQRLRDLPATLPVEEATTPDELKAVWDDELGPQVI